jgi:cell division protein FtsB
MFDFHEKRKIRSLFYSKFFVGILFLISIFVMFSAYNRFEAAADMEEKLESRRVELEKLEQRAALLKTKVEYLQNERGVEEELRSRFNVAKEGEQVIILVDQKKDPVQSLPTQDASNQTSSEESFWDIFKFW